MWLVLMWLLCILVSPLCDDEFRAYNKMDRGTIDAASEFLVDSNINRSPSSYLLNPQRERDEYADQGDTDKTMLMLKFMSDDKKPIGALNWFAVHGTSMNNTNQVGQFYTPTDVQYCFRRAPDSLACLFHSDSCFQVITRDMPLI